MIRQVMYGVAVADAIGNPLEFMRSPTSADFLKACTGLLVASDDTQMMMFSLEALIRGWGFKRAYLRWYQTQGRSGKSKGGLLDFPEMFDIQAPGNTCLNSCRALQQCGVVANDSKGNGTVMRCAHIAHWCRRHGFSMEQALALARTDAETTHLHPLAAICSETLTHIHWYLSGSQPLHKSVAWAVECRYDQFPAWMTIALRMMLSEYGAGKRTTLDALRGELGGWVAEEALTLAIGACLFNNDYLGAVYDATVISGDSDTVGAITGGLMAADGFDAPMDMVDSLGVKGALDYLLLLDGCS